MALDSGALAVLLEVIGSDLASMVELIESFEDDGPKLMRQMREAAAVSNIESMGRAAHTIKSSARDFGAIELSQLCETLERQCRAGDLSGAPGLLPEIEVAFTKAMDDLASYKATCSNGG